VNGVRPVARAIEGVFAFVEHVPDVVSAEYPGEAPLDPWPR